MPTIHNIKVSAKIAAVPLDIVIHQLQEKQVNVKKFPNYVSFKMTYTYVIFRAGEKTTNHINITQMKTLLDITKAIHELESALNQPVTFLQIDNIIATCQAPTTLLLKNILDAKVFASMKYNNEIFPGLFVKFQQGTVIIFHSGKIVLVGFKSLEDIQWISSIVLVTISEMLKIPEKVQMSV